MTDAAPPPARRSNGVTGLILGLGSMGLGVGATAVVVSHHVGDADPPLTRGGPGGRDGGGDRWPTGK